MRKTPKYKYLFAVTDVTVIFISFILSLFYLRQNKSLTFVEFIDASGLLLLIFFVISLVFIFVFQFNHLYRINIILTRAAHLASIVKALYYGALNIVLVSFLILSSDLVDSKYLLFVFVLFALPLLYVVRAEIMRAIYITLKSNQFKRNVVIVGNGKSGKLLATKLIYENPIGLDIIGFIDDKNIITQEKLNGILVLGALKDIKSIVNQYDIDEVLIAIDDEEYTHLLEVLDICKGLDVTVSLSSEQFDVVAQKLKTEMYADIPVLDVSPQYNNMITLTLKRTFDIIASIVGLILLSPLFLIIILLVKLSSRGPIFYKQVRIGKYGKPFDFYKFRSMKIVKGEDEERKKMMLEFMRTTNNNENSTKVINDKRVTWIGKILRKTSLDELPQLINVIKGDMSLVGPRPCLPYEFENYDEWQKRRLQVTPGCTGVWQVWGRSSVSFNDSVVLDLYYINNMSPWLDFQLILQTIPTMLFARGGK